MQSEVIRGIAKKGPAVFVGRCADYILRETDRLSVFITAPLEERIRRVFGDASVLAIDPLMPGEDFSALQENCPGFFVELGAGNAEKGCTVPHHNRCYKMDEDALKYGVEYIYQTVLERLG